MDANYWHSTAEDNTAINPIHRSYVPCAFRMFLTIGASGYRRYPALFRYSDWLEPEIALRRGPIVRARIKLGMTSHAWVRAMQLVRHIVFR
jgi:hypothetical protein